MIDYDEHKTGDDEKKHKVPKGKKKKLKNNDKQHNDNDETMARWEIYSSRKLNIIIYTVPNM